MAMNQADMLLYMCRELPISCNLLNKLNNKCAVTCLDHIKNALEEGSQKLGYEFVYFDRDDATSYIMVYTAQDGNPDELMSAVRIRPTLADYELEMPSYQYLTKGIQLPKESALYEGSRWVGKSSRTSAGMLSTAMLVSKLYHLSRTLAFNEIIGTISTLSENWLAKRSAKAERGSKTFHSQRDNLDILVSRIQVNEAFLDVANVLLQSALKDLNLEQVMVTQPVLKRAA